MKARTPEPIARLHDTHPEIHRQLLGIKDNLEKHFGDVQDFEFTVQDGVLFMLQTRAGKRTGVAALRIATDMVDEGLIPEKTGIQRVAPDQLNQLLFPVLDPAETRKAREAGKLIAKGLPAGPGAATGRIVLTAERAEEAHARGESVILVRQETSPEAVGGRHGGRGILT